MISYAAALATAFDSAAMVISSETRSTQREPMR
jgi:hypothetical protein